MIGFDDGTETQRLLDGTEVHTINANLSAVADITQATRLRDNANIAFMGDTKGGAFDIEGELAIRMLKTPNPHRKPNSDVIVPWVNGLDVTRRHRDMFIIDFGTKLTEADAAKFEMPFEYVQQNVWPVRRNNNREAYRKNWWRHVEPRPGLWSALISLPRFLCTVAVSKHRLFVWMESPTLPDHAVFVFARSDDYFFGILHSRVHEVWALKLGTRLETRPRYTPTTCFETFPFPVPSTDHEAAISAAAKELDELRREWLNPSEWTREQILEFPGSFNGPWGRFVTDADEHGIGSVRYPQLIPKDKNAAMQLAKRTLTNLYNERPAWLDLAHRKLDQAVFAAYGWDHELSDGDILARLLELNNERATLQSSIN
jgi:hypothetical protein